MAIIFQAEHWLLQVEMLVTLFAALVFAMAIGLERQLRSKQAGVRTHALVGMGAALFMLVSKYGFNDMLLGGDVVSIDPTRVAAQIVSGIGFLGAGIIVFRRDAVRGLTTAASIWLTAAVGMACGGQLYLLAAAVTAGHFFVVAVGPRLGVLRRQPNTSELTVEYRDGQGILREIVERVTANKRQITSVLTADVDTEDGYVSVILKTSGTDGAADVIGSVGAIVGVRRVRWLHDENVDSLSG